MAPLHVSRCPVQVYAVQDYGADLSPFGLHTLGAFILSNPDYDILTYFFYSAACIGPGLV